MSKISCVRSSLKRIRDPVVRERLLMVQAAYEMSLRDAAQSLVALMERLISGSSVTSMRGFVACIQEKGVADRRR